MCYATICIATGLHLGAHICAPHDCTHYGGRVNEDGLHGLSCRRCVGRIPHHSKLNTIIKESLARANILSVLELQGLSRSDGKCPDGMTITPWAQGRLLIWDAICWDSFAASNLQLATSGPGQVADLAVKRKNTYQEMAQIHDFVPIAVETSGSFDEDMITFLHQIASQLRSKSKDPLEYL